METGAFVPGADLPVRIVIEYARNSTEALRTVEVLTNEMGNFTVGQYLYPEDIEVGPSSRYNLRADVIEMFAHDGSSSTPAPLEVRGNTTVDYVSWTYFRSDEQPLFVDFKVHYDADWQRGIFDNRIKHAPVSFTVAGGPFGNRTEPTLFDGYGFGYRPTRTVGCHSRSFNNRDPKVSGNRFDGTPPWITEWDNPAADTRKLCGTTTQRNTSTYQDTNTRTHPCRSEIMSS